MTGTHGPTSPFALTGRTAVVTGASRGIGQAIAAGLLRASADVVSLQRAPIADELLQQAASMGRRIDHVPVDLADEASIATAISETLGGRDVDILVNNAGMQIRHDATEFPLVDFDTVLDVNLRAVFQLCQGFAGPMLDRGHGKIVNLASLLSFQGGFRVAAYSASKGAVAQLTKALCNEWARRGVNVNAIAPGYFDTELNTPLKDDATRSAEILMRIPAGYWGDPRAIGDAALFLASARADYIHGIVLPVDGGWLAR